MGLLKVDDLSMVFLEVEGFPWVFYMDLLEMEDLPWVLWKEKSINGISTNRRSHMSFDKNEDLPWVYLA